jgi:general secretion pathway protein G
MRAPKLAISTKFHIAGFSYVELLVSVAIMSLLALAAMPLAETTVRRQKEAALRVALRDIRNGIDAYKQAVVDQKIATTTGASGYPPSLTELAAGVPEKDHPEKRLYFMRRVPRDPFAPDSIASAVDTWGKRSYGSSQEAPLAGDDVFDVYSLSSGTGLNGIPYKDW